jgi:hypothetical protein
LGLHSLTAVMPQVVKRSSDTEPLNANNTNFYEPEPAHLLHHAASSNFEKRQPRRGLMGTLKEWYTPHQVAQYKSPRYCSGRLKRWQFILLHLVIIFFILALILIPIFYFIIIPQVIRDKIDGIDVYEAELDYLRVADFDDQSVGFAVRAAIPPQLPLPLKAHISPFTLHVKDSQGHLLTSIDMSGLDLQMNEKIWFDPKGTIQFSESDKKRVLELVSEFSSKQGLSAQDVYGEAHVDFGMFGITFYRDFAIRKRIPLPALSNNLLELLDAMPKFMLAQDLSKSHDHAEYCRL